ncbi:hypothetical protein ABO57_000320 [Salmonella enterica subsp. enterica serovar Abony]|nr:hypothetical protein [Salmonella enterica subsp. enterica serovar Abony]EHA9219566.1 hypothetical protein [Salmonella enterica subsp. enterica serovar Abony]
MKEVKIYTIVSDQLSPPITGESFCTDMVRHSDYAELEAKYAVLTVDNDKAMESLKQADAVVKLAHEKFSALAEENEGLKYQNPTLSAMMSCLDAFYAEWSYADPVVFTDERNLRHIASGRETSLILGKQNQEVGDIPLYRHAQPVQVDKEFIPKNLDKALGVVGVALPESKEEFNFQIERWIQRLIDRVIRYADEFKEQPVPVVPDEWTIQDAVKFCRETGREDAGSAMEAWNACRTAMLNGGKS